MTVVVEIGSEDNRPPVGAPIVVQLRDTTYIDVRAPILAQRNGRVSDEPGLLLGTFEFDVPHDAPQDITVWAHVDVDGDSRVSRGDYVTTASYPLGQSDADTPLRVLVKEV